MLKPKVVFIVGHSNWGKSQTLRELTGGSHRKRRAEIAGAEYFIRRMSNDDQPEGFIKFMRKMHSGRWPQIIAALCPDFDDLEKGTVAVLEALRSNGYRLFFWVLATQYGTKARIRDKEILRLQDYGVVEVFDRVAEADVRAREFEAYVGSVSEA